jgi:hypothetical protein
MYAATFYTDRARDEHPSAKLVDLVEILRSIIVTTTHKENSRAQVNISKLQKGQLRDP